MTPERTCSIGDCERSRYSRGWCLMHYTRWIRHGDPLVLLRAPNNDDRARLDKWIRKAAADECWPWTGKIAREGYGRMGDRYAHRVSYEVFVGPIPQGLELDHVCRNRACCNPAHLEAVTHGENMRRAWRARKESSPIPRHSAPAMNIAGDMTLSDRSS